MFLILLTRHSAATTPYFRRKIYFVITSAKGDILFDPCACETSWVGGLITKSDGENLFLFEKKTFLVYHKQYL